jgi:hypothetical protein
MPRVKASMADVSTDYNPCEPGVAVFQIEEVKENTGDDGRTMYEVRQKIINYQDGGKDEDVGRTVTSRVHIHKKDGTLNDIGLAQLKRYFEVTVGEDRANAEDADTDELLNQQFLGQLVIRSYKSKDALTGEEQDRQTNEIQRLAPL